MYNNIVKIDELVYKDDKWWVRGRGCDREARLIEPTSHIRTLDEMKKDATWCTKNTTASLIMKKLIEKLIDEAYELGRAEQ